MKQDDFQKKQNEGYEKDLEPVNRKNRFLSEGHGAMIESFIRVVTIKEKILNGLNSRGEKGLPGSKALINR